MKNVSKNNKYFSSCFRPVVVDIDSMLESTTAVHRPSTSTTPRFTCAPVVPVLVPNKAGDSVMNHHHPPKRTLSLLFKAVVFQSILNKRGRRNKSNLSYWGNGSVDEEPKPEPSLSGGSSPVLASSETSSSSESQCSESNSKQKVSKKQNKLNWLGIYVLVISLTFTVLCEKCWGIVFTSTCLYLMCVWKGRYYSNSGKPRGQLSKTEKNRGQCHN